MSKPRGDVPSERPARAQRPARSRQTVPAAWVEARPVRETVASERKRIAEADTAIMGPVDDQTDRLQAEPSRLDPSPEAAGDQPDAAARSASPDAPSDGSWRGEPREQVDAPAPVADTPASGRTRQAWLFAALAAALIVLAGGGWYWLHGRPEQGDQQAQNGRPGAGSGPQRGPAGAKVPVQAVEVAASDVPVYLTGLGAVQAFNTVVLRTRVDGEIQQIGFQEGQTVKAGDLLVQIDARPYQAALDQAVAKKRQDEATLASNRLDLERTRQLAQRSYASQQQLDQQTATVGSITAQIAIDQAAIANAQTQLAYTTIRAPIGGRTGLRLVDQGNIVHAADTTGIVEIAQIEPIAAIFTAPEAQLPEIAKAMRTGPVEVAALSSDGKSVLDVGQLALINNAVDAASGTVRLKAVFANAGGQLWPGLSINTRLLRETLRGAVTIPAEAVQRGQDQLFAYVVGQDGKAEKRVVEVSLFAGGRAVVRDGLRVGERVVTAGQYRLTPGAAVEVRDAGAPKDQSAGQGGREGDRSADAPQAGRR